MHGGKLNSTPVLRAVSNQSGTETNIGQELGDDLADCAAGQIRRQFKGTSSRCEVSIYGFKPSLPVLLGPGNTQPGEAMVVDRMLPGDEFVDREHVAAAGVVKGEQTTAHGRDHLGLASDDPAIRARRRQIGDSQRAAVRTDHVLGPRSKGFHYAYSAKSA
jgi:hypothetical protein